MASRRWSGCRRAGLVDATITVDQAQQAYDSMLAASDMFLTEAAVAFQITYLDVFACRSSRAMRASWHGGDEFMVVALDRDDGAGAVQPVRGMTEVIERPSRFGDFVLSTSGVIESIVSLG